MALGERGIADLANPLLDLRHDLFDQGDEFSDFADRLAGQPGDVGQRHIEIVLEADQGVGRFVGAKIGPLPVVDDLVDERVAGIGFLHETWNLREAGRCRRRGSGARRR